MMDIIDSYYTWQIVSLISAVPTLILSLVFLSQYRNEESERPAQYYFKLAESTKSVGQAGNSESLTSDVCSCP
jgi:hypothetical protein